ncbi:hypothetical protein CYMTET_31179 [Cymbomonas tetramitiformis]|uniref:Uncharacterized protein n=1 Tax=Cymbomonas tetramitiformis TaxID=36881 RepID=A0AAE0FHI4_9CHLO|nr:hypothetical protein CYMTET_31179 [Cymbomonas tetramitiformis]
MWKKDGKQYMNPTKLRSIIIKIYQASIFPLASAKMEADANNHRSGKARFPLVDYTVMYFDTFFGLKQLAQQNMIRTVFTLMELYQENNDPVICLFVRLCGLYHPLPTKQVTFCLDTIELTADILSGGGRIFSKPSAFWAQWSTGKEIYIPRDLQDDLTALIFHIAGKATYVEWAEEIYAMIDAMPLLKNQKKGSTTLGQFLLFICEKHLTIDGVYKADAEKAFQEQVNPDGKLSFLEFSEGLKACSSQLYPDEGTIAYLFCRATALQGDSKFSNVQLVQKGAAVLDDERFKGLWVDVAAAVQAYMWHYGHWCRAGVRADGTHIIDDVRARAAGSNVASNEQGKKKGGLVGRPAPKEKRRASTSQHIPK